MTVETTAVLEKRGIITFKPQEQEEEFLRADFFELETQLEDLRSKMNFDAYPKSALAFTHDEQGIPIIELWPEVIDKQTGKVSRDSDGMKEVYYAGRFIRTKQAGKDFIELSERKDPDARVITVSKGKLVDVNGETIMEETKSVIGVRTSQFTGLHTSDAFAAFRTLLDDYLQTKGGNKMIFNSDPRVSEYSISPEYFRVKIVLADVEIPTQANDDIVSMWIVASKGNIGNASFQIQCGVTNQICVNGWTRDDVGTFSVRHVGTPERMISKIERDAGSVISSAIIQARNIVDGAMALTQNLLLREEVEDQTREAIRYLFGYQEDPPMLNDFPELPKYRLNQFKDLIKSENDNETRMRATKLEAKFVKKAEYYITEVGMSNYTILQALTDNDLIRGEFGDKGVTLFEDLGARWAQGNTHHLDKDLTRVTVLEPELVEGKVRTRRKY